MAPRLARSTPSPLYSVRYADYYHHTLRLQFQNDLNNGAGTDPLVTGLLGPSWECPDSYQCNLTTGDAVAEDMRWVVNRQATSGNANNVPEPSRFSLPGGGCGRRKGERLGGSQRRLFLLDVRRSAVASIGI